MYGKKKEVVMDQPWSRSLEPDEVCLKKLVLFHAPLPQECPAGKNVLLFQIKVKYFYFKLLNGMPLPFFKILDGCHLPHGVIPLSALHQQQCTQHTGTIVMTSSLQIQNRKIASARFVLFTQKYQLELSH